MNHPIFLEPVFKEKIWGGTALKDKFDYPVPFGNIGECWAISAHLNGQSIVKYGSFQGKTLRELWISEKELFNQYPSREFPLLIKILDANSDLSVQVHPDDMYVKKHSLDENGKTECWYIIDCKENAEIILGHHAKSKEEFVKYIENDEWNKLLKRISVRPGDFFYVPSGTVHAICGGLLVLEIQQSSDITFRLYDYDRKDSLGNLRELHINEAIEVTTIPNLQKETSYTVEEIAGNKVTTYVRGDYFSVYKWKIKEKADFILDQSFLLFSIIIPYGMQRFSLIGNMEAFVSHP